MTHSLVQDSMFIVLSCHEKLTSDLGGWYGPLSSLVESNYTRPHGASCEHHRCWNYGETCHEHMKIDIHDSFMEEVVSLSYSSAMNFYIKIFIWIILLYILFYLFIFLDTLCHILMIIFSFIYDKIISYITSLFLLLLNCFIKRVYMRIS